MKFVDELGNRGAAPALLFPGRPAIYYADLDRRVRALAGELGAAKALVAVEACPNEHAVIAYLAALRGRHAVALLPRGDAEAFADFEADFAPDVIFRQVDGRWRKVEASRRGEGKLHPDLALMLGTSGSTGKSRFVRLSAKAVEANALSIGEYLGLRSNDRAALILPFHYCYGLSVINSHLAAGASVHFAANGVAQADFGTEMREAACTNISGVPYSYELMERAGFRPETLPALRFMTQAGGRMPPELVEGFRARLAATGKRLFVMYGQTEATARIAYVPPEQLKDHGGCVGVAIPGGTLRIVDERGRTVEEPGTSGELVYRGDNVMMGYAESRADLARGADIAELATGDIAVRETNGFFRIVGRKNRFSKIAGLRINHAGIEHALAGRGIAAAVVGDDRRLLAVFRGEHAESEVRRIMVEASGLTSLQVAAERLDALPRLASGKTDYAALARRLAQTEPPANDGIANAFRRAFYPRRVTFDDSFESLGGDSLLYVQLSLALEKELGETPAGWEKMPVGALARLPPARGAWRAVDSDLVLRALAILLVVVHHATLWPVPGGAAVLVVLVGLGIARFKATALFAGKPARMLKSLAANLAVYAPIVAGFALVRGEVPWASVLLVGNLGFVPPDKMLPYLYWFVEAYAQIVLLTAALFALAPVRRIAKADPFLFGLACLAITLTGKFMAPLVWNIGPAQIFTVPDVLYLAAFGWCAHFADTPARRAGLVAVAVIACPVLAYTGGNWIGSWVKFSLVLTTLATLLYAPQMTVPRMLARLVLPVAAASYHIYLTHRILPDWLLPQPDPTIAAPITAAVSVAGGFAVGVTVFFLQRWVMALLAQQRHAGQETTARSAAAVSGA